MVHVNDVPRGLMCNCSCPNCYEKLMAQHGNVREGCHQPVSFLVHVSWYWSFIPLVLEYFIAETALEANIQFALNHGNNLRECIMPLDASRENRYQQIGYQNTPCLYLYGVDAVRKNDYLCSWLYFNYSKTKIVQTSAMAKDNQQG